MAFQVKIHQIRAFVEVARQGSIRGASRMLNMSQPALSKSIQEPGGIVNRKWRKFLSARQSYS